MRKCSYHWECGYGNICKGRVCQEKECTQHKDCPDNQACDDYPGICEDYESYCQYDAYCRHGYVCVNSKFCDFKFCNLLNGLSARYKVYVHKVFLGYESRRTGRRTLEAIMRTNNKLNSGPEIEPGLHCWKARALPTPSSLLPIFLPSVLNS